MLLTAAPAAAQDSVVVGVVYDGPNDRMGAQQEKFVEELLVLTEREFNVQIKDFSGDWTRESMLGVLDEAYTDPTVDFVLVIGFVTNQLAATREVFPKPTFLPAILDTGLLQSEPVDGKSGIKNLNYLAAYADFGDDLDTLASITSYQDLALILDENLASAIPELRQGALQVANSRGVGLYQVVHDGIDHAVFDRVPPETDAIFVAALPRMPEAAFQDMVNAINVAGIPSYSFAAAVSYTHLTLPTTSRV